jgi:hypothetical protein
MRLPFENENNAQPLNQLQHLRVIFVDRDCMNGRK